MLLFDWTWHCVTQCGIGIRTIPSWLHAAEHVFWALGVITSNRLMRSLGLRPPYGKGALFESLIALIMYVFLDCGEKMLADYLAARESFLNPDVLAAARLQSNEMFDMSFGDVHGEIMVSMRMQKRVERVVRNSRGGLQSYKVVFGLVAALGFMCGLASLMVFRWPELLGLQLLRLMAMRLMLGCCVICFRRFSTHRMADA